MQQPNICIEEEEEEEEEEDDDDDDEEEEEEEFWGSKSAYYSFMIRSQILLLHLKTAARAGRALLWGGISWYSINKTREIRLTSISFSLLS